MHGTQPPEAHSICLVLRLKFGDKGHINPAFSCFATSPGVTQNVLPVNRSSKVQPTVALLLSTSQFYCREILLGVFEHVRANRPWQFVTGPEVGSPDWKFPEGTKLPGVLGMALPGRFLDRMKKDGIPFVNFSERKECSWSVQVLPDNVEAGRMAARYFMAKHCAHFAFTGYKGFVYSNQRREGFESELRLKGFEMFSLEFGEGKWPRDSLDPVPEIAEWLQSLPMPCAIFACNDDHARRVLNECQRLGIRVPEDVALLGCDNDEIECELSPVPISSISLPLRKIGVEAAAMLDRLLAGSAPPAAPLRLPPSGIITRRSSDVIAVNVPIVAKAVRFISQQAQEGIDVRDVVKACGGSRRYLERRFMSVLGRTPKQEIVRVRLGHAKRLLSETKLSMPEIAAAAGFSDSKVLNSIFSRELGMSPTAYRRMLREAGPK